MTQDEYKLFTGQTVNYTDDDWGIIVDVAESRLASFLCLEEFPELDENNYDLAELLANFIAAVFKFQGDSGTIESKSVRNFTINFRSSATNAFEQIYKQYEDIIEKYTNCELGVHVERTHRCCCEGNYGFVNF